MADEDFLGALEAPGVGDIGGFLQEQQQQEFLQNLMKELTTPIQPASPWLKIIFPKWAEEVERSQMVKKDQALKGLQGLTWLSQLQGKETKVGDITSPETRMAMVNKPEELGGEQYAVPSEEPQTKATPTGKYSLDWTKLQKQGKAGLELAKGYQGLQKEEPQEKTPYTYHNIEGQLFGTPSQVAKGETPTATKVAEVPKKVEKGQSYADVLDFMRNNEPPKGKVWGLSSNAKGEWSIKDENPPSATDPSWQMKVENFGAYNQEVFFNPKSQEVKYGRKMAIQESPSTQASKSMQQKRLAAELSGQFQRHPIVQGFPVIGTQMDRMEQAIQESKKTNNFVAVDQALIMVYNKMLDERSVVRESEYARTASDMGLLNRISGKVDKIMQGGAGLTPEERTALYKMSKRFFDSYKKQYNAAVDTVREKAVLYDVNPDMVAVPSNQKESKFEILKVE